MPSSAPAKSARLLPVTAALAVLALGTPPALGGDWRGNLATTMRSFSSAGTPVQGRQYFSAFAEVEYYQALRGEHNLIIKPLVRYDAHDQERSHADLRELTWLYYGDTLEVRAGISKVFWGVAESRQLVDIINQTDALASADGDQKLGQPMINLSYFTDDSGTIDLFILPWFRERQFPGPASRPTLPLRVASERAVYTSAEREKHIDFALRWNHSIDIWDIGLSLFDGTAREPLLQAGRDGDNLPVLIPHYDLIRQFGIDVQATTEEWLWKLEAVQADAQKQADYRALVGGFEYTFTGLFDNAADLGVIGEYLYDQRTTQLLQNDLLLGLRLAFSDEQSTAILLGIVQDIDGGGRTFTLEASRRLGSSHKISADLRIIDDADRDIILKNATRDDFLQLSLGYYF